MLCLAHRTLRLSVEIAHSIAHHAAHARCKICLRSMSSYCSESGACRADVGSGLCQPVCVVHHTDTPYLRKTHADEFLLLSVCGCHGAMCGSAPSLVSDAAHRTPPSAPQLTAPQRARNATRVSARPHDGTCSLDRTQALGALSGLCTHPYRLHDAHARRRHASSMTRHHGDPCLTALLARATLRGQSSRGRAWGFRSQPLAPTRLCTHPKS